MRRITVSLDLTNAEIEALKFESEHEGVTVQDLIELVVKQNIPSLLDVIETKDERRRQELSQALMKEY